MSQRQREDSRWVIEHLSELAQLYPDRWIAVHEKRIVGAAPGVGEALKQAHHKLGKGKELVTIFVEGKVHVLRSRSPKVRRTSEVRRTCRGGSYPQGLTDCLKGVGQGNGA